MPRTKVQTSVKVHARPRLFQDVEPISSICAISRFPHGNWNGGEFYVSDANKNVVALLDTEGQVTDTYVYDPFGNCTHTGSSSNPFRFSSEHFDEEAGLVYYNYRYYSPKMGRWIKRDQLEELAGYNLYVCVNNNLVMYYDSLGLSSTPLSNGTVIDLTSGLETFFYALEMNFDQLKKNKHSRPIIL